MKVNILRFLRIMWFVCLLAVPAFLVIVSLMTINGQISDLSKRANALETRTTEMQGAVDRAEKNGSDETRQDLRTRDLAYGICTVAVTAGVFRPDVDCQEFAQGWFNSFSETPTPTPETTPIVIPPGTKTN